MINLPEDGNLGSITVRALTEALSGPQKRIQLPSFQRDAVWDEARVEMLWDSILRGFPIGSLLFARVRDLDLKKVGVRDLQVSRAEPAAHLSTDVDETEFIIIDGQQRSTTVALGLRQWKRGDSARLWLDLGEPSDQKREPYRPFFVCSLLKPWGLDANAATQRKALQLLDADRLDERRNLRLDDVTLGCTWPLAATLPVPVAELITWLTSGRPGDWRELAPAARREGKALSEPALEALFARLARVPDYEIPVFLAENLSAEELGEVFQRLNKQGYAMSGEDLFFSALKLAWPRAHNLVWDAYRDSDTGRFMQPTKIVHLATRLVAAQDGSDVLRLDQAEFRRLVGSEQNESPFLDGLKALLRPGESAAGVGKLHAILRRARKALIYDPDRGGADPGIPPVLLARLPWRVWHTLAAWLYHHDDVDERSRLEMIRYALLNYFFTKSKTDAKALFREPFSMASEAKGADKAFPGFLIYEVLSERHLLEPEIPTPDEFRAQLGIGNEAATMPAWSLLQHEAALAFWVQRSRYHQWFPSFDPTLYRTSADFPYDVDHILPKSYASMRGRKRSQSSLFWRWRSPVMNGPGNLRYWPRSLNRADQNKNLRVKFLLGDGEKIETSYLRHYSLETVVAVRAASVIPETSVADWEIAANEKDPANWYDPERMLAFRRATDARRLEMYTQFYDGLNWHEWVEKTQMILADRIRDYVIESLVKPARESGKKELTIRAGDVHQAMELNNRMPAVCGALDAGKFYDLARVAPKQRSGPQFGANAEWVLSL